MGRIIALLLFIASSGFTTIVHACAMEATQCCDTSRARDHKACENPFPLVAGPSVQREFDCHTNTVAGGLAGVQGLIEKDGKPLNNRLEVLSAVVSQYISFASSGTASWLSTSYCTSVSPPSVEKYVLNASFLI
jgi:hypothetical protein